MIQIKNIYVLESILSHSFHPKLTAIIIWTRHQLKELGENDDLIITEGFRRSKHRNDLHPLGRAADLRSWIYKNPRLICNHINKHWAYDPSRPTYKVCVYHDSGKGIHFHIQVHPLTVKRKNILLP